MRSQLKFCHYLSEDSYEAATRLLPKPLDLKVANSRSHEGEWDLVFIHKRYGVVVGETKSVGVAFGATPQAKRDAAVVKRVTKAINQLDKEERILAHVLSDLQHPPKIRKTLLLPYIRRSELRRIMGENSTLQQVKIPRSRAVQVRRRGADRLMHISYLLHFKGLRSGST